ncbi:hypothetical protein [Gilliamella sp. Occ4-3]|uniref:hypothetical protein n=1 Tax=Gilliamella sp. Occ4-3 TaxID=3120254 RepID=UPI00080E2518|nr:hypothetical protein [Gilliamella apicola]OCG77018.1 hypothetical protein A9G44_05780 [Gilliamella apicola]
MQYHFRHKQRQANVLNLLNNHARCSVTQILFILSKLSLKFLSKSLAKFPFSLTLLLLLPYSLESQALSATTSKRINGTVPYLTFEDGTTKVITTDDLLSIRLSDGRTLTPQNNSSSSTNPIELPASGQSFENIDMIVPTSTNSVNLSDLVAQGNWGDDDGDGQDGGVMAEGSITLSITDKNNQTVSRNEVLTISNAPYKVKLSSTGGSLSTQYGEPKANTFTEGSETYYIKPKVTVGVNFVRPNLQFGTDIYAGPAYEWNPDKGFLVQPTNSVSYALNFPTTGADGLYFDLDIVGVDASQLTWEPVTHEGITATVTRTTASDSWIPNGSETVTRVTLTGPEAKAQWDSANPNPITVPNLPEKFELKGKDSSGNVVVKYGFVLQKWFVNGGTRFDIYPNSVSWCSSLGYRIPQIRDLTNTYSSGWGNGWQVAVPPSSNDYYYQRRIGAGLATEWGDMMYYTNTGFEHIMNNWTSDSMGGTGYYMYTVGLSNGIVYYSTSLSSIVCVTP